MASPSTNDEVMVIEAPTRSSEVVQALSIQVGSEESQAASREAGDKGADKGKAQMLPHFTVDYGPDMPSRAIGMHFKATNQVLQNCHLMRSWRR